MKKILYSIFAVSTLLFATTSCTEDKGTSTEVQNANADEDVDPNHIRGYGDAEPGGAPPSSPEAGQMYGFDRDNFSQQMTTDLGVDETVATEMVKVYYDRNRQLSEMEQRYQMSETTRTGGQAANSANTGTAAGNQQPMSQAEMEAERKRIDDETDKKVKGMLTPEQYESYKKNRTKYNSPQEGGNTSGGSTSGSGSQTEEGNAGAGNQ
jgi:hypothetical protein